MTTRERASWREDFTETQQSFEAWRESRQRGARIPETLWEAALALAERHGVAKTATTLRLDYYALKRRLAPQPATSASISTEATEDLPRFVELPLGSTSSTFACTLEVEGRTPTASKLRLELQGIALADLDALLRSVWSRSA